MSFLKPQNSFSLNFASLYSIMRDHSSVLFSWNFIWFGQMEPIKVQNFRLLTTLVKFHPICTLLGSFCWKYIKFQLKKYREFMSHGTEEWFKIWRKTDLCFRKWHEEFGKFLSEHSKVSKLALWWDSYIQCRKCVILKFTEELCVKTMKNDAKFEEKLTCCFKIGTMNLRNFHLNIHKSQKFAL